MVERISCLRRCCAIRATSPNQGGAEGTDWQEDWTMTDPSAILSMSISLMRMGCTSSLRRHIFCSDASCYTLVAHSVGQGTPATCLFPLALCRRLHCRSPPAERAADAAAG